MSPCRQRYTSLFAIIQVSLPSLNVILFFFFFFKSSLLFPMTSVYSSEDVEQVEQLMISESSIQHGHDHEHTKWMSSKMRLMKKMMNSNQSTSTSKPRRNNSVPESGDVIRVCSDCRTTKTPLWRSGPQGPKVVIHSFTH